MKFNILSVLKYTWSDSNIPVYAIKIFILYIIKAALGGFFNIAI